MRRSLQAAQRAERDGQALADVAMHCLALGHADAAVQLLRRALVLHAAPQTLALWRIVAAPSRQGGNEEAGEPQDA